MTLCKEYHLKLLRKTKLINYIYIYIYIKVIEKNTETIYIYIKVIEKNTETIYIYIKVIEKKTETIKVLKLISILHHLSI